MMNLTCPCCGHARINPAGRKIVERLEAAEDALSAREIIHGMNIARSSWKVVLHRLNANLAAMGYRIANVHGMGVPARYRLEKLPETEAGKC